MLKMPLWIRQILTEDDQDQVYCPVRIGGIVSLLTILGNASYLAITTHTFDAVSVGSGAAAVIGAVGAGAGIKAKLGG